MTTAHRRGFIPALPPELRLEIARRTIAASQREFAEQLGVSKNTVQRAESGYPIKRSTLLAWAMVTGVDLDWLEHGTVPTDGGPDQGIGPTGGKHLSPVRALRLAS